MKRRKNYRRTQGHRQSYTEIEITGIGNGIAVKADPEKQPQLSEPTASATEEALAKSGEE